VSVSTSGSLCAPRILLQVDRHHIRGPMKTDPSDIIFTATFNDGLHILLELGMHLLGTSIACGTVADRTPQLVQPQDPAQFNELASRAFDFEPPFLTILCVGKMRLATNAERWAWRHFFSEGSLYAFFSHGNPSYAKLPARSIIVSCNHI
jgi:hypothetical protein